MEIKNLIFHSRAVAEVDWACQRARYWEYEYENGIKKDNLTLELFIGSCLHDAVAGIAFQYQQQGSVNIDQIATDTSKLIKDTLNDYYLETTFTKST